MLGLMERTTKVKSPSIPLAESKSVHKMTLRSAFRKRNAEIGDGFRFEKSKKRRKKDRSEDSNFRDDRDNSGGNGRERDLDRYYIKFNALFREYLDEIDKASGTPMLDKQRKLIEEAVKNNKYMKLTPEQNKAHRREYSKNKKEIIAEWERQTGQTWERYTEPVYNKNGKIIRNVNDLYECHHIINCGYSGDNQWWNMSCLRFPDMHQGFIHRKGSPNEKIFK